MWQSNYVVKMCYDTCGGLAHPHPILFQTGSALYWTVCVQ